MSPRGSAATRPSAPYARRPSAGQPKSSRQQFSACGACRMRRVRCDLKDLPMAAGPHPACSNCKERGLKCVDEFADVKAVKLLRRGRRLQQVEAIYGKAADPDSASSSPATSPRPSAVPPLQPEFFASPFWRWFSVQRPVIDLDEFPARFFAHAKGTQALGTEGRLLAMLLVVWAASFGVDERGAELDDLAFAGSSGSGSGSAGGSPHELASPPPAFRDGDAGAERERQERRDRAGAMIREVLGLIDVHGVLRRPTWDGVRVLLLVLPLMEEVSPIDRLTMFEATLVQAHALCTLAAPAGAPGGADDASVRARIFWYAHVQEGITAGLMGGRLILDADDLAEFHETLPALGGSRAPSASPPLPWSAPAPGPAAQVHAHHQLLHPFPSPPPPPPPPAPSPPGGSRAFTQACTVFSLPLHISSVCRRVHAVLTGPRAKRRAEGGAPVDTEALHAIWDALDRCWDDLEDMRRGGSGVGVGAGEKLDLDVFVSGWQIFIFECHNIVRDALKHWQRPAHGGPPGLFPAHSPPPPPAGFPAPAPARHLHDRAAHKCHALLPRVLRLIQAHLAAPARALFRFDTGRVRDGVFFAGVLAAAGGGVKQEPDAAGAGAGGGAEEGVALALRAFREMRWAFAQSDAREESIRRIWEERQARAHGRARTAHAEGYAAHAYAEGARGHAHLAPRHAHGVPRPHLPPLNLALSPLRTLVDSAPNTAYSTDGSGGWAAYTPPGTGTSAGTSAGTGMSGGAGGSPGYGALGGEFKAEEEGFYPVDLQPFGFSVPVLGLGGGAAEGEAVAAFHAGGYLDGRVFAGQEGGGAPYGDCGGFYH